MEICSKQVWNGKAQSTRLAFFALENFFGFGIFYDDTSKLALWPYRLQACAREDQGPHLFFLAGNT